MCTKETLLFIGKCLTLSRDEKNLKEVKDLVTSQFVNWDKVVEISTAHFVFPALYLNFKQVNLLDYLPKDLVSYMGHIAQLNRDRNLEIIEQAKEINTLLRQHQIIPVFLKGAGFLLEELYSDPSERMVGDIDFLVDEDNFIKTAKILESEGYLKVNEGKPESPIISKHYPRLRHNDKIAAVEIHIHMVKGSLANKFNYESCKDAFIEKNDLKFLGKEDQLALVILAKMHNDNGRILKTSNLRSSYDVYILSKMVDFNLFEKRYDFYTELLNPFLGLSSILLNSESVRFTQSKSTLTFIRTALKKIENPNFGRNHSSFNKAIIYLKIKFNGAIKFLTHKEFRNYYLKKVLKL